MELAHELKRMHAAFAPEVDNEERTDSQRDQLRGRLWAIDHLQKLLIARELTISRLDRRKFNKSCALFVGQALKMFGTEWFLAKDVIESHPDINRDATQAKHWGLIEEAGVHTGNGKTDGLWRVLPKGSEFVTGSITIPSYRLSVGGAFVGYEGPEMTFSDAMGEYFNFDIHMANQPDT